LSEVFATGASLTLLDHFSPELRKIIAGLEGFDKSVQTSQAELNKLGFGNLAVREGKKLDALVGMTGVAVDKMTAHFDRLGLGADKAFDAVKAASGGAFTAMKTESGEAIDAAVASMGNLSKVATAEFDAVKAASAGLWTGLSEGASASVDAALSSIGRLDAALEAATLRMKGMADEAAAASVRAAGVAPVSGVGQAVTTTGGASLRTRTMAAHDQNNAAHGGFHFRPHGMAIPGAHLGMSQGGDGMAPLVGGLVIGELLKKGIEAGFDFEHWASGMKGAGFTDAQVGEAKQAAWANAGANPNASATDSLKNILELNKATGDLAESMKLLPVFSTAEMGMQSVKAEGLHSKFNGGTQILNLARGLEELGVTQRGKTPEEREANVKHYTQELLRTMIASRGLFDGNALFAMTNNSGGAAQNFDERMATVVAPIIGDIMKASKLGNADYMLNRSYAQGVVTSKAVLGLERYGLTEPGDTYSDKGGEHLNPNSKFAAGLPENAWEWSKGILAKLQAQGIDTSSQKAMNEFVNAVGSNKSTTGFMRALFEPGTRAQIQKEMDLRDKVPTDAAGILQNTDPVLKMDALHKKWEDLLTALGGPLVDPAIAVLTKLTSGINTFAQTMEAHPDLTKVGAMGAGVAALGLTGYGAARMLGFGGGGAALSGAATALDASALALKEAAVALGGGVVHGGTPGSGTSVPATGGKPSLWALNLPFLIYEGGKAAIEGVVPWLYGSTPEQHEKAQSYNPWDHPIFGDKTIGGVLKDAVMPSAHAAEGATIPGLNPSGITGQASTAIAGRLGLPAGIDMSGAIERATAGLGLLQKQEELNVWQFGQLTTSTGIVQTSFDGLNTQATGITGALASFSAALDAATAKVYGLFGGGAGVGDVGGGSGFTQAAYTTWDSPGSGSGGGAGSGRSMPSGRPHGGATGNFGSGVLSALPAGHVTGSILSRGDSAMAHLLSLGVTREAAAAIVGNAQQESSITGHGPAGDHGTAHGMFQWRFDRFAALQQFAAARGKPWQDENTELTFAVEEAKRRGNAGWLYGHDVYAANQGMKRFEQYGESADGGNFRTRLGNAHMWMGRSGATVSAGRPAATVSAPPPRKVSPGAPAGGNMTTAMNDTRPQQHHIYLDGKKIAQVVTKHQASAMRFPNSMGGPDPHGHYTSPGTPLSDVA